MHQQQRQQTTELLRGQGIDYALFASPDSVKWLTGFAPPIELGNWHFFAGGPALVWYENGQFTLFTQEAYSNIVDQSDADLNVVFYVGYTVDEPISATRNLVAAAKKVFQASGAHGKVGFEPQYLTATLHNALLEVFGAGIDLKDIETLLLAPRAIKTEEEISKLRRNFELVTLGHQVARKETQVGKREIDVWSAVHEAIQQEIGERVAMGNDCVVNYRTNGNVGGFPETYPIRAGDSLTVDLSTLWQGYWSDSCMTYYPGEPTPEQAKAHKVALEALEYGISLIRPGVVAREVDQKLRAFIEKAGYPVYPHHSGHGVGVSAHEAPRLVPYNDEIIQQGMVIMLEPGIYLPGKISVRIEDGMLVTADGVEVLTKHSKAF